MSCSVIEDGFVSMRDSYWLPIWTGLSLSDTQQQPPIEVTFSELNYIRRCVKFGILRFPINLIETTLHPSLQLLSAGKFEQTFGRPISQR
jgi:hypothetical protein